VEVRIDGQQSLSAKLLKLVQRFGGDTSTSVTVGFTQRYALYVHEVQARHVVGQWKYLETPARQKTREIARMIEVALKSRIPFLQALMMAGLNLQRAAQLLTPVDTSALKASAFTCPTKDVEAISQTAFEKSENVRLAQKAGKKFNTKTKKGP
jgi:hypothetical protein